MAESTEPTLVLDASTCLSWFFVDESDKSNDRILNAVARSTVLVPVLWELEIANALVVAERQKRITLSQTQHWLELLLALQYTVADVQTIPVFDGVLALARAHQLSSYDASYLQLAVTAKATLVTRDTALQKAAKAVGVEVMV